MSFYRGPDFIGSVFDHPSRRTPAFSPAPLSRASVPISRSISRSDTSAMAPLLRQMLAVHEAAHCTWHWVNRRSVHSVVVHGDGGEFRAVEGAGSHTPLYASNDVTDMLRDSDRKTREGWLQEGVAFMVARTAQRRVSRDPAYDSWCGNDINMVDRIVRALGGSARERAENLQWIEDEAEEFVNRYWKQIGCLADAILRRGGRLDEQQIRSVLASSIKLNETAAKHALSLACAGCVNYSAPFAWSDDSDAADLYHLGEDGEGGTQLYFPYGANNQVYITALKDAIESGSPAVASFAQKLLDDIEEMQAQSKANTTNPRGWGRALPRRPGDEENFRRRVGDGYLKL
jgi:hypothetical protein